MVKRRKNCNLEEPQELEAPEQCRVDSNEPRAATHSKSRRELTYVKHNNVKFIKPYAFLI